MLHDTAVKFLAKAIFLLFMGVRKEPREGCGCADAAKEAERPIEAESMVASGAL